MRLLSLTTTTLVLVLKVSCQTLPPDFTKIPSCAFTPLIDAVAASGCSQTDVACWCANVDWKSTLESEVSTSCSTSDQAGAYKIIEETCSDNGVTVNLGSDSGETSSSPIASPTSSTVPGGSSTAGSSSATLSTSSTEALPSSPPSSASVEPSFIATSFFASTLPPPSSSVKPSISGTDLDLESTVNPTLTSAAATNARTTMTNKSSSALNTMASDPHKSVGTISQPVATSSAAPVTAGAGRCAPFWAHRH